MKKNIYLPILPIVTVVIAVFCFMPLSYAQSSNDTTSIEEVKQETKDLVKALEGYTVAQRDEAMERTDQALKKLDSRINDLETRIINSWDEMNKTAREKAQTNIKALRKQRNEVAEWYGALKNSSVSAWEQMKKGFSDAYQAINDSWEKAKNEYAAESK